MLNPQNTLTLVIDIQERLVPALDNHDEFVANTTKMIKGINLLGIPSLITEQYPKGLGSTLESIKAIIPDASIFAKTQFSAWTDDVVAAATAYHTKNIIIMGCETHVCVLQTVLDLRKRGINVYLPQECVASRTTANKANGLQQCREAGAVISNIESILFQLLGDAKHPSFKSISKLIV